MDANKFLYEGEAKVKLLEFSKCEKSWKEQEKKIWMVIYYDGVKLGWR